MNTVLTFIGIIILVQFLIERVIKFNSHQLNISPMGINKIPKLLLELAKINKDKDTHYNELSKEEQEKYLKIDEKLHDAIWCTLTYIDSHDLIHVQKPKGGYFHKISKDDRYLIREELGELNDNQKIYYILYRKDYGWLKGANLIGYLHKTGRFTKGKEEIAHLFEFPETLLKRRFFTKHLQKKFNLKEDTVADYIEKDELGFSGGIYMVSYEKENKEGVNFWFRIY